METTTPTPFAGRLLEEAAAMVAHAESAGVTIRLMGGIGIRFILGDRWNTAFDRPYGDIDIICRRKEGRELERLLAERGWEPAREFNALNGGRRMLFNDPVGEAQVDVFVEAFEMCHELPLRDCLDRPGPSLPATDLLMSKLQINSLNAKDRSDIYALLTGCEVADGDPRELEAGRIADLTSRDWGLYHTFELNLERLREGAGTAPDPAHVVRAVDALERAMEEAPKSRGWKMRARIGERKRWYDEPEEVDRD